MAETVASLQAVIGADVSGLDSGLASAESKITGFGNKLKGVGSSVMGAGAQITALTAPIGLAFGVGLSTASQFQDVMKEIETRASLTGEELEQVSDFALQMGADTNFSGQQAADGLLQLMTSGASLNEAMAILPSVMDAATASGADLGATADTVTDIMAAFGLGIDDAQYVVDSLAQASGSSSADMVSLGQGFGNVASVAKSFGLDVNQTAAALAILSENGVKSAEAGTALKTMLQQMDRDTPGVKAAWDDLGTSMYDLDGNMRDLPTVLAEMKQGLENLPAQEQNRIMTELAGTHGILALNALLGATSIEQMQENMAGAATASDIADAKMNTFSGAIDSLKGSFETLMITALTPFMDNFLTPMVQDITAVVNSVTDWVDENPELASTIVQIAAAAAIAGPVIIGLGAVISGFGSILSLTNPGILLLGFALGTLALTDWQGWADGMKEVGEGLKTIATGDLGDGLSEIWTGTGNAIESTFIGQLANGLIDIADQSGVLDAIGLEAVNVSEGFAAWGFAIQSAVTLVGVGLDDIKRGFDRFGLDVQLSIAGFLLSIEQALQGTPFEVDWGMENVVADLEQQIVQADINGAVHDILALQLSEGEINLDELITVQAPDGTFITMPLGEAIDGLDMTDVSARTEIKIRSALETALENGDLETVTFLQDAAIEMGIGIEDLQPQIDALASDVVSGIESADYTASVTATVNITAVAGAINDSGLWAGMQNAIGAGGGGAGSVTVNNYTTNNAGSVFNSDEAAAFVNDGQMNGPQ